MKKYKNICIAFALYVIAVLVFFSWTFFVPAASSPGIANSIGLGLGVILILSGIFFGLRSVVAKESTWAGYIVIIVGILTFVAPSILSSYTFWGFLYNLGIH
ncbi:hypothetical protein HYW72_01605 [Candidatus Nomurabacteria bacterium]|nr:hypothetical protein [Candidatus Nomurabacteria bacterium]